MNVIIFGATGGIGKWAVQHALKRGHHVTAYVRNAQKITETNERLMVIQGGDPRSEENDKGAFRTGCRGLVCGNPHEEKLSEDGVPRGTQDFDPSHASQSSETIG